MSVVFILAFYSRFEFHFIVISSMLVYRLSRKSSHLIILQLSKSMLNIDLKIRENMVKLKKIILSSTIFVCSHVLANQNASLLTNINEMTSSIQKFCKNPEQLTQYQDLNKSQQNLSKDKNAVIYYPFDIIDISDYPSLDLSDQCQRTLVSNQIEIAKNEKKLREGHSSEAFIYLDLLIYTSLRSLYDNQELSALDIQKMNTYEQKFLTEFDQDPNDKANASIALSTLMRFFKYNLNYTPRENRKIFDANIRFKRIYDHIYKNENYKKFNEDVRFIIPVRLTQLSYSNEEYELITAIQNGNVDLIKSTAAKFSRFYNNKQLANQFHNDYDTDADFDEVIRPWWVGDLLTFAFFKVNDLQNVKIWIERSSLIEVDETTCNATTLVSDSSLNIFLKNDKTWYQPKFEKMMKGCEHIQADTRILSKFDYHRLIRNYEKHCDDKYGYKTSLLKLKDSKFLSDSDFYTTMALMSDLSDTIEMAEDSSITNRCVVALKENKVEFLQFYVDHMKSTAFNYQDAKNELKTLK